MCVFRCCHQGGTPTPNQASLEGMEFRKVSDSNMVVDGQRIVPKNWLTMLNIKNTHWEDPAVFKEDGSHMDTEKGFVLTKPGEWMPFGDGRR